MTNFRYVASGIYS